MACEYIDIGKCASFTSKTTTTTPPTTCRCKNPDSTQDGKNGYTCSNKATGEKSSGYCAHYEYCYAHHEFVKGQWGDGCKNK